MNEEVLAQLKDIHLPPEPSWWPLAYGYYAVLIAVLLVLALVLGLRKLFKPRRSLKKLAQRELANIEHRFRASNNIKQLQTELVQLIGRLAREKHSPLGSTLLDLPSSLNQLSAKNKEQESKNQLVELLNQDRFRAENSVNGQLLLAKFKEQLKIWRI